MYVKKSLLEPGLLEIDAEKFRAGFNRAPFLIRHRLADHPLFSLRRLIDLSTRLPEENIKYNAGDVSLATGLYEGPRTGLSVQETIRRIEECRSWMVLKNVEHDPEYRELLNRCLDEIEVYSDPIEPGMRQREGFVFHLLPRGRNALSHGPGIQFPASDSRRKAD